MKTLVFICVMLFFQYTIYAQDYDEWSYLPVYDRFGDTVGDPDENYIILKSVIGTGVGSPMGQRQIITIAYYSVIPDHNSQMILEIFSSERGLPLTAYIGSAILYLRDSNGNTYSFTGTARDSRNILKVIFPTLSNDDALLLLSLIKTDDFYRAVLEVDGNNRSWYVNFAFRGNMPNE